VKARASRLDAVADQLAVWFGQEHLSLEAARARLKEQHGITISIGALSGFWSRRQRADLLDRVASGNQIGKDLVAKYEKEDAPTLGTVVKLARSLILHLVVKGGTDAPMLKLARDFLDSALSYADYERKIAELSLARTRFQRETCELFLKWRGDQRAREVADSGSSNSDKIETLGAMMFGELWRK